MSRLISPWPALRIRAQHTIHGAQVHVMSCNVVIVRKQLDPDWRTSDALNVSHNFGFFCEWKNKKWCMCVAIVVSCFLAHWRDGTKDYSCTARLGQSLHALTCVASTPRLLLLLPFFLCVPFAVSFRVYWAVSFSTNTDMRYYFLQYNSTIYVFQFWHVLCQERFLITKICVLFLLKVSLY